MRQFVTKNHYFDQYLSGFEFKAPSTGTSGTKLIQLGVF